MAKLSSKGAVLAESAGDLLQQINRCKHERAYLREADVWRYLDGMCQGLKALHDLRILHRDLKCANVFLSHSRDGLIAKLGDFNVSKVAKRGLCMTQTGTPYYASPEENHHTSPTFDAFWLSFGATNTARPRGAVAAAAYGLCSLCMAEMPGVAGVPMGALSGTVKSWNALKGFGFIEGSVLETDCASLPEGLLNCQDVMPEECRNVHGKFMTGRAVDFKAQQGPDGRYKATSVSFPFAEGWPVAGWIKSYSVAQHESFIVSSQMNQDIRFDRTVIDVPATAALQGQLVVVDIAVRPDGKYNASRVSLQENLRMGPMQQAAPAATPYVNGTRGAPEGNVLNSMVGRAGYGGGFFWFNLRAGMGCLTVSGYAGDVAFNASDPAIIVGSMVSFSPSNTEGRLWANNVLPIAQGSSTHSVKRQTSVSRAGTERWKKPRTHEVATGQHGSGQIKTAGTYSEQKGFGFIRSDGLAEDIFFMRTYLPEEYRDTAGTELVGCTVNFELSKTPDGTLGEESEDAQRGPAICQVWRDMPYDAKSDMWSLGCVLYEMVALRPPFRAEDMEGLYHKVVRGQYPRIPAHYGQDLADVIAALLQVHPRNRPSVEQLLQMPQMMRHSIGLREETRPAGDLLSTIKLPKNAIDLSGCLPKPRYVPSDEVLLHDQDLIPHVPPAERPPPTERLPASAHAHQAPPHSSAPLAQASQALAAHAPQPPQAPRGEDVRHRPKASPVLSDSQSRPPLPPRPPRERLAPSEFPRKSGECGFPGTAPSSAGTAPSSEHLKSVLPEGEANPARSLDVETPQSGLESPRRLDRRGNPILPRELTPGGLTPHHVTFADEEGQPEVVEVLKRQVSATDRLANGFKAIQSSLGCGKMSRGSNANLRASAWDVWWHCTLGVASPRDRGAERADRGPSGVGSGHVAVNVDSLDAYLQQREKAGELERDRVDRGPRGHVVWGASDLGDPALQQRAKELARKRAVGDFRNLLRHRYGSVIAGWRAAIDPEEETCTWEVFEAAAKKQKFSGDLDGLWEELVAEDEEVLLLERLEPAIVEAKQSFLEACADRYGSVERAFLEMDLPEKPILFEYADSKGIGTISLEAIEPEVTKDVFGLSRCKEAEDQLMEKEPYDKERKTIMRRAIEQCGATHRPPEEQRQHRQEIVDMLEERFDSPVRAWANLLDIHAKGKLKRKEFQTSMAVLGYTGNTNKLWEELGLKKKQSVRFKDLCPEVIEEIREFKNLAGKKIITLIQVSEVAAGPGKSKKAGAPVDNEEFYKVMDAIEYPGDPERLLRHLDPGNVGYANTRTLRILNEQRSEEKAVPQFLKKYAENRQALLEQKIASVVIPPAKELLAKQDSLRESCLEEQQTKKETRNAKEEFLRKLTNKFGSIAKAWRLALDPELKYAIENVDHLMKGMKRAGQMPAEGGEHALRTVAEKIFQACMSKETEQISLDCLDPRTPAMLEKFKDLCEERFGSLQDAFEKVDVDGVGIVSREDFRMLCHEVKATDGIFRLMEFLDPKRTGEIRLSLIDGEVAEDAMLATQTRRQMQQNAQEQGDTIPGGLQNAAQERAKRPARRALEQVKHRLVRKYGSVLRAWKIIQGNVTQDIGRDGWLRFFEHVQALEHFPSDFAFLHCRSLVLLYLA
eukprot:s717_g5.t2